VRICSTNENNHELKETITYRIQDHQENQRGDLHTHQGRRYHLTWTIQEPKGDGEGTDHR